MLNSLAKKGGKIKSEKIQEKEKFTIKKENSRKIT